MYFHLSEDIPRQNLHLTLTETVCNSFLHRVFSRNGNNKEHDLDTPTVGEKTNYVLS